MRRLCLPLSLALGVIIMAREKVIVLVLALLTSQLLHASKEGVLELERFTLESAGIGESGHVVVTGTQNSIGITSLNIVAFGKSISVSSSNLEALKGINANGLQISYEHGYSNLGGKTVYITFIRGFTTERKELVSVAIAENGTFRVLEEEKSEKVMFQK